MLKYYLEIIKLAGLMCKRISFKYEIYSVLSYVILDLLLISI